MLGRSLFVVLSCVAPGAAIGAELEQETVVAYERYIDRVERGFALEHDDGGIWLEEMAPQTRARLRDLEILSWPGNEDGILDIPGGLIHHWRAAAFVPRATLARVLAVTQDYDSYAGTYDWIIRSRLLGHVSERDPRRDRFRARLRIERSASVVTSTIDIWTSIEYRYPRADVATAASDADCIREVEDAGEPDERRLPVGKGRGYLWRANTYATYLARDGGVYIDMQTVGLSRGFPPLLGWIVEPIARRLGRGSAADSLERLREAVARLEPGDSRGSARHPASWPATGWCGSDPVPAAGSRWPASPGARPHLLLNAAGQAQIR